MDPIAVMTMEDGAEIVIELLPAHAPNTVASFIHLAKLGVFDGHAIERIVPGKWVDASYRAFHREEAKYLIPRESELHPEIEPLDSHPGCICMGGYKAGLAGGEFFFPLKDCPEHKGVYPVFGKILSGMDEILRLEKVETVPVDGLGMEVNCPKEPQIIKRVTVDTFGEEYPMPVTVDAPRPKNWE